MTNNKLSHLFFFLGFFVFLGFYVALLLFANVGQLEFSRLISIPIRLLVSAAFILLLSLSAKCAFKKDTVLFLFFSFFYLLRVIVDWITGKPLYINYGELLFYYLSFAFLPFVTISSIKINITFFDSVRKGILLSAIVFGLFAAIYLFKYIGSVGRLGSNIVGEEVISPLILSYCSALIMGISIAYLNTNKTSKKMKRGLIAAILLSIIPFFLGASRGGLIALVIPLLVMYSKKRGAVNKIKLIFLSIIGVLGLIALAQIMGSGIFTRVGNITQDISDADSSAIRIFIWYQSLTQFWNNPIMGDKLAIDDFSGYPHNIFIEVLQCTGILGFMPFIILVSKALIKSNKIFKFNPRYSWLSIIFLQCLIQAMFSGSIYSSSWFWFSMALILCFPNSNKKKEI